MLPTMSLSDPLCLGLPSFLRRAGVSVTSDFQDTAPFAEHWPGLAAAGWSCGKGYLCEGPVVTVFLADGAREGLFAAIEFVPPGSSPEESEGIFVLRDPDGKVVARYTHEDLGPLADACAAFLQSGANLGPRQPLPGRAA